MGAKSPECVAERVLALPAVELVPFDASRRCYDGEGVIIDGLLGTGASGPLRGEIAACLGGLVAVRERGVVVVAIDLPSGLDATTGVAHGALAADLTITFGSIKRGHLIARGVCGQVVVVDIGLTSSDDDPTPRLVDARWWRGMVPPIDAAAHKGTRKKIAIIGGDRGMAGAVILAARAALRSGIGMVRAVVHPDSVLALQQAEPAALASTWTEMADGMHDAILSWADAVVIGPGLGRSSEATQLLSRLLAEWRGPTVLDADALNAFAGDPDRLAAALGERRVLLTPHPVELGRLMGRTVDDVLASRFEIGREAATRCHATVLLKGVPTIISDGRRPAFVSAAGTPALAPAGSGDVLSGIAGTMMAQLDDPMVAGAVSALVHGRAAELSGQSAGIEVGERTRSGIRGTSIEDVVESLRDVWTTGAGQALGLRYPVLAELTLVGER